MRYILLCIFIVLDSNYSLGNEFPFEYQRVMVNFSGVALNQSSIIAYGDGGILLRSSDRGNNREQLKIVHDSLIINKVVNDGDYYIGILNNGYLINSKDDGKNWMLYKISDNRLFFDMAIYNKNIYLISGISISII